MVTKNHIRELIGKDNLAEALTLLDEFLGTHSQDEFQNEVTMLNGRLTSLENRYRKHIVNNEDYGLDKARIADNLLNLLTTLSFLFEQLEQESLQEKTLGELPIDLLSKRILVFDIDNTVLKKGESLSQPHLRPFLDLLEFFINKGFLVVFITGNNYSLQKRRVLDPIIDRGLANSVICFSDGGSRMFISTKNQYEEVHDYSKQNEIETEIIDMVDIEFAKTMVEFEKDYRHKQLRMPGINVQYIAKDLYDKPKEALLTINPIKPSFYENRFSELKNALEQQIMEMGFNSVIRVLDKYTQANAMKIEVIGSNIEIEVEQLRGVINGVFADWDPFTHVAWPELEKRGGNFCSQIAIKPFKIDGLRRKFLGMLRERLDKHPSAKDILVLLGGSTTIDIQKKGVDKRKAIIRLVTQLKFDPSKMIYFGDEFRPYGNDLAVALMEPFEWRPERIIHVGDKTKTDKILFTLPNIYVDGNGPQGTFNYLRFLKSELE